jgi:hypothetical protein
MFRKKEKDQTHKNGNIRTFLSGKLHKGKGLFEKRA